MLIIGLLLCIVITIVGVYYYQKGKIEHINTQLKEIEKRKNIEERNNYLLEQQNNTLTLSIEQKRKEETQLTEQLFAQQEKLNNAFYQFNTQINSMTDIINNFAKEFAEAKESEINEHLDTLRTLRDNVLKSELEQCELEVEEKKKQFEDVLTALQSEIYEYTVKRDSIIAALAREKKLKDEEQYHSINLTPAAVKDISYLEEILSKLNNKNLIAKVLWEVYLQVPTKQMLTRIIGTDKCTGIYRITNKKTQECYIGQSTDVAKRITEHIKGTLGIQSIADQAIHHAMADEGITNWTFELLEKCAKEELNNREKFYISFYKSNEYGYNATKGGS